MPTRQTDRQTDGRQTVTLPFPLDAAINRVISVTVSMKCVIEVTESCKSLTTDGLRADTIRLRNAINYKWPKFNFHK